METEISKVVSIPEDKKDILEAIATIEKREMTDIISELIDDYAERHKETLELLSKSEWVKKINGGKQEVVSKIKGKTLNELEQLN
ncbi:MAG: hypothetical protein IEMM0008_1364 [bacterium]|nr:MAG: hypothetical protein IEMM0008_1364 [bacterium]